MKKSKKITALILAAMLAVSSSAAMAVTVSAEENTAVAYSSSDTKSWGDYDYQILDDGTVEITDYKGSDTNLVIPSEIDGKKVTSIGSAFLFWKSLTEVKIPDSVTSIGDSAFCGCASLTNIEIPNSVTSIGKYTFSHCKSLTNIEIPDSVTSIGEEAFSFCESLTNIEIPDSVTSIGEEAFSGCTSLKEITVDKDNQNYSSVNGVLFNKNKTELIAYPNQKGNTYTIPNGVTSIGIGAFAYCTSLTEVKIPNSVTSIGYSAFSFCESLTNIEIPNSVTSIVSEAFSGCTSLTNVEIPNSVTSIEITAFYSCTSLTNVEIPDSVTSIGYSAFAYCTSLTEVKIPNSVTSISIGAFKDCNNLTIYGYVGSTAETYAKENNIPFVDINSKVLKSKVGNISVKGAFDDGVTLNVEEATVKNAVKAYNITLKDENGNTIQPNGTITVSIPSDNANCKVYWIKEDGTKVDMNATYVDGDYEFTTDHLSVYALIADTTEPSQESSGEQNNSSSESSGEQSNNPSEPSNNTNSSKTISETGKNAVNTGDNNTTAIAAIFAAGALIAAIIMRKKKA